MGKLYSDIIEWGKVKPYFDKQYRFNTIDIETIDNELFIIGYTLDDKYYYKMNDFYNVFNDLLIENIQSSHDILTWTRYDNTHLLKLILQDIQDTSIILNRVDKITPIYTYQYKDFTIELSSIIKSSMLFKVTDFNGRSKNCTLYNQKNLFQSDLLATAKAYNITSYSKLGEEYHKIDRTRFFNDKEYKRMVLLSNELDNRVLKDIAYKFIDNFKSITGKTPKTIFTAGSIARSYLLWYSTEVEKLNLNFKSSFNDSEKKTKLLDYAMRSYHGGKIESYIIGSVKKGLIIDITSAYPYALSKLPKMTRKIIVNRGDKDLHKYYYAFINCDIVIDDETLIHPIIYENPINKSNLSPYGYIKGIIITKLEYDYLIAKGAKITVHDYIAIVHDDSLYPYANMVTTLFKKRMEAKDSGNNALADLYKSILNSLYGITYELTDNYVTSKEIIKVDMGAYHDPMIDILKSYRKRINLSTILSELKIAWDNRFYALKSKWHNPKGISLEQVNNELIDLGYDLEIDNLTDLMLRINELTETKQPKEINELTVDNIEWFGYRAGDNFNPVIASYITAFTRTYLSDVSQNIIENGGDVYLNMTDSIIFNGNVTLDVFSDHKILGKFEKPSQISDIIILGAGRYEYRDDFKNAYTVKNRGFSVSIKDKSFYSTLDYSNDIKINHKTFVSSFKATTKKYGFEKMGYLIEDSYEINPFNLGGKRVIDNTKIDVLKSYTKTKPIYLEKDFYN